MQANATRILRITALACLAASVVLGVHATQQTSEANQLSVPVANECAPLYELQAVMVELENAAKAADAALITRAGTDFVDITAELIGVTYVTAPIRSALMNEAGINIEDLRNAIESTKVQIAVEINNQIHFSRCPAE